MKMGADWPEVVTVDDIRDNFKEVLYAFPADCVVLADLVDASGTKVGYVGGPCVAGYLASFARSAGLGFNALGLSAEDLPEDIITTGPFGSGGQAIILKHRNEDLRGPGIVIVNESWKKWLDDTNRDLVVGAKRLLSP